MNIKASLLVAGMLLASSATAEESYPFEKYPARDSFKGKPATPLLDSPTAKLYRSTIRFAAKAGPNFAGHYTIAYWGYGSQCINFVIVDASTGKVHVLSKKESFTINDPIYRLDSTLLVTEQHASPEGPLEVDLFNWDGSKLVLLKKLKLDYSK